MKRIEEYKKVLYVIDVVNGFIYDGKMHDQYIERIINPIKNLVEQFLNDDEAVVFFKEAHTKDSIEFDSHPEHCLIGNIQAEVVDQLKVYLGNDNVYEFNKNSTSGIFAPGYSEFQKKLINVEEEVMVGDCTDICINNFAIPRKMQLNEENRRVNLVVPVNCVETFNNPDIPHDRDLYNFMAFKLLEQAGINLVEEYQGKQFNIDDNYDYKVKKKVRGEI